MMKPGSWGIVSESDPRWNYSGRSEGMFAFPMPAEAEAIIEKFKKILGDPPGDLQYWTMKD